jgi:hypothetical protein
LPVTAGQRSDQWIAVTSAWREGRVPSSGISNVVNLLGVSAWYPQLLKGAIICSAPPPMPPGGGA